MVKQTFLEKLKNGTNVTLSKVFDNVEKVSKISTMKLKIINLEGKIKNKKTDIGNFVFLNEKKFSEFSEIINLLGNIKEYKNHIIEIENKIDEVRKKEKK